MNSVTTSNKKTSWATIRTVAECLLMGMSLTVITGALFLLAITEPLQG